MKKRPVGAKPFVCHARELVCRGVSTHLVFYYAGCAGGFHIESGNQETSVVDIILRFKTKSGSNKPQLSGSMFFMRVAKFFITKIYMRL